MEFEVLLLILHLLLNPVSENNSDYLFETWNFFKCKGNFSF